MSAPESVSPGVLPSPQQLRVAMVAGEASGDLLAGRLIDGMQARWSDAAPALSINRYCASGLSAVQFAAQQAMVADGLAVGGGV
ncbi:MAG: hypothetical protein EBR18_00370, partial [Betaproteobacteria bacterium]|nr:hypothetical protein [Betaproteobacteria bacterium]